ncbi:MAG: Hydroxyacid dehydrogenase [Noviherbaspirillum sp.]|nr:Hydroxyacid dehydrogenase [Noviherbaspirillum sp.]
MKKIAILDDYQGVALSLGPWEKLKGRAEVTVFRDHLDDTKALIARLSGFHVLVANRERTLLGAEVLAALPHLELIVTSGKRNAAIDVGAASARGATVCGTDTLGYPTAELTWAMILGFARHLPAEAAAMRAGAWQTTVGMGLNGKVLGIVGFGRVGTDVGRIGAAFGMKVLGWSRSLTEERAAAAGASSASLETILREADVVSVHLPLSTETRHLISTRELSMMKPGALLVNTARGPIIDEDALIEALKSNKIRGAALDVFNHEPLAASHPLRKLNNVLLTPHLGYVTEENYRMQFAQIVENIDAWLNGKPVRVITSSKDSHR